MAEEEKPKVEEKKDEEEKEEKKEEKEEKKEEEKKEEKIEEKKSEEKVVPTEASGEGDADEYNPEEEVTEGNWTTPQVEVKEVKTVSGEEDEEVFWSHRSKLYRWCKNEGEGEWKERGVGDSKLLRHKETKKIRFLLRQEKTLKIVANHYVVAKESYCKLTPNVGSDKVWVWTVVDFAEDEAKLEQFALRFGQVEQAKIFKEKFEEACKLNEGKFESA